MSPAESKATCVTSCVVTRLRGYLRANLGRFTKFTSSAVTAARIRHPRCPTLEPAEQRMRQAARASATTSAGRQHLNYGRRFDQQSKREYTCSAIKGRRTGPRSQHRPPQHCRHNHLPACALPGRDERTPSHIKHPVVFVGIEYRGSTLA